MWSALAGLAAPLIGGILGYEGQQDTNRTNSQISDRTNQINQANSREQMAFQERMSSTAHQRAKRDLEQAGLNPILAANNGASSPAGAAGTATAATMSNSLGSGISSAFDVKNMQMAIAKNTQDLAESKARTTNTSMDSMKKAVETDVLKRGIPASELTNDVADILRPAVKGLKGFLQGSPKHSLPPSNLTPQQRGYQRGYMDDFHQRQLKLNKKK